MDPNAALDEMRDIAGRMLDTDDDAMEPILTDIRRLAELFIALDGWLYSGGALPEHWRRQSRRQSRGE